MKKQFKRIILVLVWFIGIIALTGCKKDENVKVNKDIDSKIVGTWNYEESGLIGKYVLKGDGTGTYTYGTSENKVTKKITYKTEKGKLKYTFEGDTDEFEQEYYFKGKDLIIKDSFGTELIYKKK